jgi:putative flippase GtrA
MFKRLWAFKQTRFIAVGILNTVIDFSILNILVFGLNFNKILANSISVSVAMTISYLLNKSIVFKHTGQHQASKIIQFIIITAFGLYVIQNGIIDLLIHHYNLLGHLANSWLHAAIVSNSLNYNFIALNSAKLVATIITLFWNYLMYRYLVFRQHETTNK